MLSSEHGPSTGGAAAAQAGSAGGDAPPPGAEGRRVSLRTVARAWTRIGVTGFGGPPAHIALLRQLVVDREGWMDAASFQDANAACGLLPGPASTQLAIFCAYRVAGVAGALVGGLGFILPAVALIIPLSAVFLAHAPPRFVLGAGAGAGAAVAAVAVHAARGLLRPSLARVRGEPAAVVRWGIYVALGAIAADRIGPYLVLVRLACGLVELALRERVRSGFLAGAVAGSFTSGGIGALAWTAFKVGALSFGGGFVIIPLMQGDAVHTYHWMSNAQFLNAVALGQITPGPVVATVAAVGYGAHGLAGGLLAALVAFTPSFVFVLVGGRRFDRVRESARPRAFLDGAGPAAIGAILGAAVVLARALQETWQYAVLAVALAALLAFRQGVVATLLAAAGVGLVAALAGAPLP